LGQFVGVIDEMLRVDVGAPPKQRHTASRVRSRLVEEHGAVVSYSTVRDCLLACAPPVHTTTAYLPGGTEATLNNGTVTATRYYQFAGNTIAMRTGNSVAGTTTVIPDTHNTALAQVNQNPTAQVANASNPSTITLTRIYTDPFGNPRTPSTGPPTTPTGDHGFLNKPVDLTGLTQIGARYYNTTLGVFISVDPVLDPKNPNQWNPYPYASNNPTTRSDPTGLVPLGPTDDPTANAKVGAWKYAKGTWTWAYTPAKTTSEGAKGSAPSGQSSIESSGTLGSAMTLQVGVDLKCNVMTCAAKMINNAVKENGGWGSSFAGFFGPIVWSVVTPNAKEAELIGRATAGAVELTGGTCWFDSGLRVCQGGWGHLYSRGGTTIGTTYVAAPGASHVSPDIVEHEKAHVTQWQELGLLFVPGYFLMGTNPCTNVFEIGAGLREGGYAC
jgi:RHS repeat-associated protein